MQLLLFAVVLAVTHQGHCFTDFRQDWDNILYVRSDNGLNTICPRQPCETLDHYANVSHLNNTKFMFMPGLHTLSKNFRIDSLMNIELDSMKDSRNETEIVKIQCYKAAGFMFKNVNFITIKNLQISACGQNIPVSTYSELGHFQAAVALKDVTALTMQSITIRDSNGYGIAAEGLYGYSIMEDCLLVNNTGSEKFFGGNFVLKYYEDCPNERIYVRIMRCKFLNGSAQHIKHDSYTKRQTKATGISLFLSCTNVTIHMSEVQLKYNKAYSFSSKGGNLFILLGNAKQYTSNTVIVENSNVVKGTAVMGGGAYVRFKQPPQEPDNITVACENYVSFRNVNFTSNSGKVRGGALYILFETASMYKSCPKGTVEIDGCYFVDNILNASEADSGLAINIYCYLINGVEATSLPFNTVIIARSHFLRNKLLTQTENSQDLISGGATVFISKQRRQTFINDSSFVNNSITAISAFRSNIVFSGIVTITNNTGLDGGGLVLCQSSYILFSPNTTVTFENNKAILSGGGIYAEDQCLQSKPLCFYQVHIASNSLPNHQKKQILDTIHVVMINNTAGYAGSQIFGGFMDKCHTTFGINSTLVYKKIFNEVSWQWNKSNLSYVTSFPKHICFCAGKKINCEKNNRSIHQTIYPGQLFDVSLVAVGQFNNPVPATILILANISRGKPYHHTIKAECSTITLTSGQNTTTREGKVVILIQSDSGALGGTYSRSINITYRNCPLGTVINKTTGFCYWSSEDSTYNASDQTIQKPGLTWIGYHNDTDTDSKIGNGFIKFSYCPQLYCDYNVISINISETFDPDQQCRRDRTGILCGACRTPYSSAISSTKCVQCSDHSITYRLLLLLGPLVVAVLALLFMLWCNVTITDGTINGFLFYTSMFHVSEELFLHPLQWSSALSSLVAWFNLYIGMSVCFYNGFDVFGQVILNLFVPLFVWIGLGLLILISSKSSRITRFVGKNAVKVLATIILLSYTTILQAEVAVFSCSTIQYPNNTSKQHWLPDGNVLCWQGKHLGMVVIGVLFGIATVLYTIMLLFIQPLQRYSHVRGLRWVAKLKPFFDAYTSPHVIKHRYRFWTGLLLLFRMISSIWFAVTSKNNEYKDYGVALTVICILILSIIVFLGGIYKQQSLNILNASFYTNLTILSFFSFYSATRQPEFSGRGNETQITATYASLVIAFVTFLFILAYHVYKRLKETSLLARCVGSIQGTRCWRAAVEHWNRGRIQYVRLPQEDPQVQEMNNDFNGERQLDENYNWDRELDVQDRELNSEDDHVPKPDSQEESCEPRSSEETN
ncbi:uncharacterized protein LOC135351353 [Halichondria panicea]|uniref:uncharacterized protein LOC135351353 n=1 Tax=Halichondria panicea TaxID=6063 RepID=UPI00312B5A63